MRSDIVIYSTHQGNLITIQSIQGSVSTMSEWELEFLKIGLTRYEIDIILSHSTFGINRILITEDRSINILREYFPEFFI